MLARILFGVGLVLMPVFQPPNAQADPDSDFLAWLQNYGIDLSALMGHTITPQSAIELGHDICDDLRGGKSADSEMSGIFRMFPNITEKQAGNLVSAAQMTICPDTPT